MSRDSAADEPISQTPNHSRLAERDRLDRVTLRVPDEHLSALESLVDSNVYHSRSEAIRAGIQHLLEHHDRTDADDARA